MVGPTLFNITWEFGNMVGYLNMDFENGTTPDGLSTWHVAGAQQELPGAVVPYNISSNGGPKYLHKPRNLVIQPLATSAETSSTGTVATVAMGNIPFNDSPHHHSATQSFEVLEGQLSINIAGLNYTLIDGDVVVIPKNESFEFWSTVEFTKILVTEGEGLGLASRLISDPVTIPWNYTVWPTTGV